MNLWGVAILELDCNPDHYKGTNHAPCDCPKTHSNQPTNALIARPMYTGSNCAW